MLYTLNDFYRELSYGELRNIAMASDNPGTIRDIDKPTVVHFLNEGLTKLHGKYDMNLKSVLLQTYKHITFYHLRKRFALSQQDVSNEPFLYLIDNFADPFEEDVLKIKDVYNSQGLLLPLNNSVNPRSVFTPEPLILQVPFPKDDEILTVLYKSKHVPITPEDGEQTIYVPDALHTALRAYVASRIFGTMGTAESLTVSGMHTVAYENACREAEELDLVNTSVVASNTRFEQNSWI